MRRQGTTYLMLIFLCVACLLLPGGAHGQNETVAARCAAPRSLTIWINCLTGLARELASGQIAPTQENLARLNQRSGGRHVEAPSLAGNSTSLVDQSQPPDLFSFALGLAGLRGDSQSNNAQGMTITTTAYALYAGLTHNDPLDPAFYLSHAPLRRFAFTVGYENANEEEEDASRRGRATIIGARVLVMNRRDVSRDDNRLRLHQVAESQRAMAVDTARFQREVTDYLYRQLAESRLGPAVAGGGIPTQEQLEDHRDKFVNEVLSPDRLQETVASLTSRQLREIEEIILRNINSTVAFHEVNRRVVEDIRQRPQLALNFQSRLRQGVGTDEYRGQVTFDHGLARRINLSLNASFDYEDSQTIGGDRRGGRIAAETQFRLNRERLEFSRNNNPFIFSVGGEGRWLTNSSPSYTGQAKLTIPLFTGVDFPISVSVANRSELVQERTVRGRFGFTFDFAKLLDAFSRR